MAENTFNSFNRQNHPECGEKELFIGNVTPEVFRKMAYSTKRMGAQTFDRTGLRLLHVAQKPVFVNESELPREDWEKWIV